MYHCGLCWWPSPVTLMRFPQCGVCYSVACGHTMYRTNAAVCRQCVLNPPIDYQICRFACDYIQLPDLRNMCERCMPRVELSDQLCIHACRFTAFDQYRRIWASSRENLFTPYANNKGVDQPAHPRSLISTFVVHCLDGMILLISISEIWSIYLASVAAHGSLSLSWSQIPMKGFLVMWLICQRCGNRHL